MSVESTDSNGVILSIFASAIRPHLWESFLNSLRGSNRNKYKYEVVFAGHVDQGLVTEMFNMYPEFRYITTGEIKPAQCYEIARRACVGELVCWTADDCVFSEGFVDKVYEYYKSLPEWQSYNVFNNTAYKKVVISCKTNENGNDETMQNHRFFSRNQNTPLMAPIGVMNREYLDLLGGFDSRYICGQYENSTVMQVLADGGKVHLYEDVCVSIDHANKHGKNNNFWSGYNEDREQLENSWCVGGYQPPPKPLIVMDGLQPPFTYWPIGNTEVTLKRNDKFVQFPKDISLTESTEPRGIWK